MTLSGSARLAGVIGWPVSHSRSPRLHGHWLARHGLDGAYVPLAVAPENLEIALRGLGALGFAGANVTVPHKEAACALVDDLDPLARRIGAVNTLVVGADGRLSGRNTDAHGFMANLRAGAPDWRGDAPAVVLGAGGAARAVVVGLLDAGVPEVRLTNRTQGRAETMAAELAGDAGTITVIDWSRRGDALDGAGLVVNTTTLGMAGQAALDLDLAPLPLQAVVTDIVYTPLETPLLANGRARGHTVVDGLGMLLHQAVPGFRAWFGIEPVVDDDLRRFVLAVP